MMIELVVIKLVRVGAGTGPDYTLKIYGNGTVLYEGRDNVKIRGDVEELISERKLMELLSEFKDSGFFSLEYNNIPSSAKGGPHTIISISMPTESGESITKKITHYHGDENVPKELIMLEDKIENIVDSKKWISDSSQTKAIEQEEKVEIYANMPLFIIQKLVGKIYNNKKSKSPKKKKAIKILSIIILLIIIACLFTYFIYPIWTSSSSEDNTTPDIDPYEDYYIEEGENLVIINITTASDVEINESNPKPVTYTVATQFDKGKNVSIYYELKNYSILTNKTTNNQSCDLLLEIIVVINSETFHSEGHNRNNIGLSIEIPWFITNDDWPAGEYSIEIIMTDKVIDESTSQTIFFTLV